MREAAHDAAEVTKGALRGAARGAKEGADQARAAAHDPPPRRSGSRDKK